MQLISSNSETARKVASKLNKPQLQQDYKKAFINLFQQTARHKHRHELFRDWIKISSITYENVGNRFNNDESQFQKKEDEYKKIYAGYELKDRQNMATLFCYMVMALEIEQHDFLGTIFMELELGSDNMGQFFTPTYVCDLMAQLTMGDTISQLNDKPYISICEPTCGAGGMIIAASKQMIESGFNPNTQLLAVCTDIDAVAARMCYVQLSMLGIPAVVNIGNTLTMNINETLYTPYLHMNFWRFKDFFYPPERENKITYLNRGNITDVINHDKYIGSVVEVEGHGYSCGKKFHPAFNDAENAIISRDKLTNN